MAAPEKIYLQPRTIEQLPHQNIVYTKPLADNSIEYTRTDAFIEKAEIYLKGKLLRYIDLCERGVGVSTEEFIEDFKNYMKGE